MPRWALRWRQGENPKRRTPNYEGVNGVDYGIILGAGINIIASGIVVDARYGLGLRSIHEESMAPDVSNSVILLSAGFRF
ncbi:MAG: hypothetical protein V1694_12580 [Candidatus Eisenbacteria bacterium]